MVQKLRDLDLTISAILIIVMGVLNIPFSLIYLLWPIIDNDFNFFLTFAAFRYALSSHLARIVTQRAINSEVYIHEKSEKQSVQRKPSIQIKTTNGLDDFAAVTRFQ